MNVTQTVHDVTYDLAKTTDKETAHDVTYDLLRSLGLTTVFAVPVSQLKLVEGKLGLAGATLDALKATPEFEYAQH